MFKLFLLYSIIYFCRTGDYIPFVGKLSLLDTVRHELLVAVLVLMAIIFSDVAKKNLAAAFQNGAWKAFSFFVLLGFLSIPLSVWPGYAFSQFIDFFKLFLFGIMIVSCIRTEEEFNKYIVLYIICMLYVAADPLLNYLSGHFMVDHSGGVDTYRAFSNILFYRNPNVLAITLLQCLPFIYYKIAYNGFFAQKLKNGIWAAAILLIVFIVIVTGSRGGFLVLAGLAFFISYRSPYRKLAMLSGIILGIVMWSMMDPEYQHRFETITQMGESDTSAENRILGLEHGFAMLKEHPILGVGIGCYPVARWHMFHTSLWAHNLPGQLMGDLGILGTVTFVVFLFKCFKNTRETRKILLDNGAGKSLLYYQSMALDASLFGQIINGIGQHSLYLYGFYVIGAMTVVLLRVTEARLKEQKPKEVDSEKNTNHRLLFPPHTVKRSIPPA